MATKKTKQAQEAECGVGSQVPAQNLGRNTLDFLTVWRNGPREIVYENYQRIILVVTGHSGNHSGQVGNSVKDSDRWKGYLFKWYERRKTRTT